MNTSEAMKAPRAEDLRTQFAEEVQERITRCRKHRKTALDLSGLGISGVPPEIQDFKFLTYLNLSVNAIAEIPGFIGGLEKLEYLDLSFNKITALPEAIAECEHLKTLNLCGNKISALPESIDVSNCPRNRPRHYDG